MQTTTVQILTRYIDENGKPKSGQIFHLQANDDIVTILMYNKEVGVKVIQELIQEYDKGCAGRHVYVSHDIIFHPQIELSAEQFEKKYVQVA